MTDEVWTVVLVISVFVLFAVAFGWAVTGILRAGKQRQSPEGRAIIDANDRRRSRYIRRLVGVIGGATATFSAAAKAGGIVLVLAVIGLLLVAVGALGYLVFEVRKHSDHPPADEPTDRQDRRRG